MGLVCSAIEWKPVSISLKIRNLRASNRSSRISDLSDGYSDFSCLSTRYLWIFPIVAHVSHTNCEGPGNSRFEPNATARGFGWPLALFQNHSLLLHSHHPVSHSTLACFSCTCSPNTQLLASEWMFLTVANSVCHLNHPQKRKLFSVSCCWHLQNGSFSFNDSYHSK